MRATGLRAITAVAALAAPAVSVPTASAQPAAPVLGARGVEAVALRAARAYGERHPSSISYASGTLADASRMTVPKGSPPPSFGSAEGSALVDLVLLRGNFTATGPRPRHTRAPRGRVLELIVDAHRANIEIRALWTLHAPEPLSALGRVIVLHGAGAQPRRH